MYWGFFLFAEAILGTPEQHKVKSIHFKLFSFWRGIKFKKQNQHFYQSRVSSLEQHHQIQRSETRRESIKEKSLYPLRRIARFWYRTRKKKGSIFKFKGRTTLVKKDEKMGKNRSTSIPAELWPRYKFFSAPETQARLDGHPRNLKNIKADPSTQKWDLPSSLVTDASWDKYSFLF